MPASMPDDQIITKYLVSILSDEQRAELAQLLGENSMVSNEDPDDLAQDALMGRIAMDRLPPRLRRMAMLRVAPRHSAEDDARFAALFPHGDRLGARS